MTDRKDISIIIRISQEQANAIDAAYQLELDKKSGESLTRTEFIRRAIMKFVFRELMKKGKVHVEN